MTVHISEQKQDALYTQFMRFQTKVVSITEKEHKAQLKRRRYVTEAFGKWLDTAPQAETDRFLAALAEAGTAADRKRIADYRENLPAEAEAAKPAPAKEERAGASNSNKQPPQATAEG